MAAATHTKTAVPATTRPPRIWYEDLVSFLTDPVAARRFYLHSLMTVEEQLNAIMRLALYFALAVLVVTRNPHILLIPMLAALTTFALYESVRHQRGLKRRVLETLHASTDTHGRLCHNPTPQNPFMNVLMTDRADRAPACCVDRPEVGCSMERIFNRGQVRNFDDIYGRASSSRQFYTMPNTTTPNDQAGFAQWLYGVTGPTRKEQHASWVVQ